MSEPSRPSEGKPRTGIARSLPPDLAAAYEAASKHAVFAFALIATAKMATQGGRPLGAQFADELVARCVNYLNTIRPTRDCIDPVRAELVVASEPGTRFGESAAHLAAVRLADDVLSLMWRTADLMDWLRSSFNSDHPYPLDLIRANILPVCRAVAEEQWHEGDAIITAVEIEAAKASQARGWEWPTGEPEICRTPELAAPDRRPADAHTPATPEAVDSTGPPLRPQVGVDWRAAVEGQVSQLYCGRPVGLDPPLAEAFEAVATAVRECTRLVASVPYLWQRPDDYRALAAGVGRVVDRARTAYLAIDVRLRRAGGPNVLLEVLNDALTIRDHAPTSPATSRELNPILTRILTNRAGWFPRVDGRGVFERMLTQLARVPVESSAAGPTPHDAPAARPNPPVPAAVRNWLVSRFLLDPTPDRIEGSDTPIVLERVEPFNDVLLRAGLEVLPTLEACRAAGWIEDIMVDVFETTEPDGPLTHGVRRLNLPVGRHRLLGIYSAVLTPPPSEPPPPPVRLPPPVAAGRRGRTSRRRC